MDRGFVIAIDGPVASGKGTLAKKLSKELNGFYLYTGAMFRCVALRCIETKLDMENESEVEAVLPDLDIRFEQERVLLNGRDVTNRINEPDAASGASVVGVYEKVRETLLYKQQQIAEKEIESGKIVIAEGRDTGTVVFPDASLKVYLTAKPEVRAKRRMEQYIKEDKDLSKELEELKTRDERDKERVVSPLPARPEALDYFVLDNSEMSEGETLSAIKNEMIKRKLN